MALCSIDGCAGGLHFTLTLVRPFDAGEADKLLASCTGDAESCGNADLIPDDGVCMRDPEAVEEVLVGLRKRSRAGTGAEAGVGTGEGAGPALPCRPDWLKLLVLNGESQVCWCVDVCTGCTGACDKVGTLKVRSEARATVI